MRSPFINDVKVSLDEKHRMHNENGDYFSLPSFKKLIYDFITGPVISFNLIWKGECGRPPVSQPGIQLTHSVTSRETRKSLTPNTSRETSPGGSAVTPPTGSVAQ